MREIKFRAWDKVSKKVYPVAHLDNLLTVGTFVTVRKNEPDAIIKIEDTLDEGEYELMQSTGLKDKNGKEIYEGDIIAQPQHQTNIPVNHRVVEFKEEGVSTDPGSGCEMVTGWFAREDALNNSMLETSGFYVVGNIYENPELLKETD